MEMSKGKHAARAENRNFQQLEERVKRLLAEVDEQKQTLRQVRAENIRLSAIANVFDGTKDLIAELEQVKKERDDLGGRNFVLEVRLERWAKMIMAKDNAEFLRLTPDLYSDFVELGYFEPRGGDTRHERRAFSTAGRFKKAVNIGRNGGKVVVHG
jgi:hypothetical protein